MSYGDHRLYLYDEDDEAVELVVTTDAIYMDNRPMNNRKLIAHKGFNNELTFNVRNRDRKLQNIFSETLWAYIQNPSTKKRLVTKKCEHTSNVGTFKLYLQEGDIQNIDAGLYKMYISKSSPEQKNVPVFSDQNYNVSMDIEIKADAVVEPVATQLANNFFQVSNVTLGDTANIFTTSAMYGNQDRNFQNARHSVAIYPSAFTGNVLIQGSIVEGTPGNDDASSDWFNISNVALSNSSVITHETFNINANWIRCLTFPANTTSTITKVLLRN